ncbi:MAG: hypothetical protein R3D02_11250 [Hyphomicrobiales bacterium]
MRITVIVPTTAGPRLVVGIIARPRLPASLVITADDYRPLDDITERYDAFVGPAGPLRRGLDLDDGSYELRLDAPIDGGRSWELPVALAHAARQAGAEIVTSAPDLVVWATGALDPDLAIRPDDYHLADKLDLSGPLLGRLQKAGARTLLLLPADPAPAALPQAGDGVAVATFAAALALLRTAMASPQRPALAATTPDDAALPAPVAAPLAGSGPRAIARSPVLVIFGALVLAALVGLLIWRLRPAPPVVVADPPPIAAPSQPAGGNAGIGVVIPDTPAAPAAPPQTDAMAAEASGATIPAGLFLQTKRDMTGDTCVAFLMRDMPTIDDEFAAGEMPAPLPSAGLCAIGFASPATRQHSPCGSIRRFSTG